MEDTSPTPPAPRNKLKRNGWAITDLSRNPSCEGSSKKTVSRSIQLLNSLLIGWISILRDPEEASWVRGT